MMQQLHAIAMAATLVSGYAAARGADIVWSFNADAMGWSVADLNCTTNVLVGTHPVSWHATGGNPGGFIRAVDPSSNCYTFNAPAGQLGDWSAYNGGRITFSLRASHNNYADARKLFLVGPSNLTLVAEILPLPATTWTSYTIPLTAATFRYNSLTGAVCTPQDFATVLGGVAAFRISAEYGSQVEETVDLDEVAVRAHCYANCDLSTSPPILNVDDFTCFINAFAAAASLPHGQQIDHYANCDGSTSAPVLNVDDFTCFINAFAAGCP